MVDKRACRSLRVDRGRGTESCATTADKNNQRIKIVLNNPAKRVGVAIHMVISDLSTAAERKETRCWSSWNV